MGTADRTGFRKAWPPFKGLENPRRRENFLSRSPLQKILPKWRKPSANPALADVRKSPRSQGTIDGNPTMLNFLDHHPTASLWLIAIGQGLAMLGLNVALRALVL
jgi:hypothetical protein